MAAKARARTSAKARAKTAANEVGVQKVDTSLRVAGSRRAAAARTAGARARARAYTLASTATDRSGDVIPRNGVSNIGFHGTGKL